MMADTHDDEVSALEEELASQDKIIDALTQTLLHLCVELAAKQKELKVQPYQAVFLRASLSQMKRQRDEARADAERLAGHSTRFDDETIEVVCNHCGGRVRPGMTLIHAQGCALLLHMHAVIDNKGGDK